ncbi:uncharacterized protein [Leptinotarsa decemlineata]|uniref:uncharacterized protein n=1 Tax=Leptinotarsa decemlineata TaxID=7539 RepID=UPI003D30CB60
MISFDVSNLFTSVPKSETLPLVSNLLSQHLTSDSTKIDILTLLKFCISQDFFVFNNKFYSQPDGLAMGNPLSPFLADIFMENLENSFIINKIDNILSWHRYVDDCLVFIDGNSIVAHDILNSLNNLHPKIKFTLEIEQDNKLNFLDLTITKTYNKLDFSIYRKPTQTDHVIPFNSFHPMQHKLASFNCYVNRLLNTPLSPSNFNLELNTLKQIAVNNGYQPYIIHKLISEFKLRSDRRLAFNSTTLVNSPSVRYFSLPYFDQNMCTDISKFIENTIPGTKISFKSQNNLSNFLVNSKDKINKLNCSGVYKLNCSDCSASYIGRTCRPLFTRINEHIKKPDKSAFGHHIKFHNHNFSPNRNSKILHKIDNKNFLRLDLFEELEISKELSNNDHCLNTQVNLNRDFLPLHKRIMNY